MLTEYIRRRFAAALLPRLFVSKVPGHTTRAPPVRFELATNAGIQLYALANFKLDNLNLSFSVTKKPARRSGGGDAGALAGRAVVGKLARRRT